MSRSAIPTARAVADIAAALQAEALTLRLLIVKSENQHRRAVYWRAFRRGHAAVVALLAATAAARSSALEGASVGPGSRDGASRPIAAPRRRGGASAAARALEARCDAAAACLLLAARRVASQQSGDAFAGLLAVLVAGTARYLQLVLAMRDALRDARGGRSPRLGDGARASR